MPVEQAGSGSGSGPGSGSGSTPATRRARGLADIAPKYVAKSGLCEASDMESSRGTSIRIHHLTAASSSPPEGRSRFPKLDECAHFHYDFVELGPFQVALYEEELKPLACEDSENKYYHVSVTSLGKTWVLRRSYENFRMLDSQLHRCIYDRKFSGLPELPPEENVPGTDPEEGIRSLLTEYLSRFSQIAGNLINCGPVLNWLELDNRGRRLLVPDGDNCPINTPAVAAAYAVKRYAAQAGDEISFEVGDMISVIDMPPPEESVWWRGKRGFQVGFFPCECVAVIGDKVPRNLQLPSPREDQPSKPVLRKHGKLIAFFRSFILSRPSRRRLKQSGILKERVFGCDLGEHLLNSGHDIPMVLKCCAEFIETHGIVDGIYRLSGVTSNIQKLRNAFDEDRVPALYEDEAILQDIHSVASLLKMYFRELPNPLCTYQLYHTFVNAIQSSQEEGYRLLRMRDAVQKLPPPHYRTLEYLMRHLARVAEHGGTTGMTPRNVAIVWAPNLLRCKELEVGGVAALQGVGVQAVVTEFLVCYTDLIFSDGLPPINLPQQEVTPKRSRPKSLAISTPTKLLSLEEARSRALLSSGKGDQEYIEVGGGPSNLPAKYHTVIELPGSARKRAGSKRSPLGWKSFFSKSGRKSSAPQRKASTPSDLGLHQEKAVTESDLAQNRRRLRPVKSAESLASGANSSRNSAALEQAELATPDDIVSPSHGGSKSSGHNRSVSHDSYFDNLAETPLHSRPAMRPSRLQEEENEENFSSSLDLSEIHLNFDLEESEMRIFSEDETLVSTSVGSGSFVSHGSPRIGMFKSRQQNVGSKRVPMRELPPPRAWPEDTLSGCPSTDPSPKKQKTCSTTSPGSTRSKRSRLEEALGPASEFRYIDSQSPENQQVVVHVDVHEQYERKHSLATPPSFSSCNNHMTSPSLADATVSDNESFTLHSSGLTTPDTPLLVYTPLRDDTNSSTTTPDYENLALSKLTPSPSTIPTIPINAYERLSDTPSPSPTTIAPKLEHTNKFDLHLAQNLSLIHQGDSSSGGRYENVPQCKLDPSEDTGCSYVNMVSQTNSDTCSMQSPIKKESHVIIRYENVKSPKSLSPKSLSPVSTYEIMLNQNVEEEQEVYEPFTAAAMEIGECIAPIDRTPSDRGDYEPVAEPLYQPVNSADSKSNNVYQNIPSLVDFGTEEEHLYEDIQLALASSKQQQLSDQSNSATSPTMSTDLEVTQIYHGSSPEPAPDIDPDRQVYQQVKYLRRSIHEVNQLLDGAEHQELNSTNISVNGDENSVLVCENGETSPVTEVIELPDDKSSEDGTSNCVPLESENCVHDASEESTELQEITEKDVMDIESKLDEPCEHKRECLIEDTGDHNYRDLCVPENNASSLKCTQDNVKNEAPVVINESRTENHDKTEMYKVIVGESENKVMQNKDISVGKDHKKHSKSGSARDIYSTELTSPLCSPERRSSLSALGSPVDPTRRKFESEIGRDILRERRMKQELQEVRSANLGNGVVTSPPKSSLKQSGKCNVRELLSKFETSPCEEQSKNEDSGSITLRESGSSVRNFSLTTLTPKPVRRSDPTPKSNTASLPPCLRVRAAKAARNRLANSTSLSVSLDSDRFLSSSSSQQSLVRVRTSPDINLQEQSGSDMISDKERTKSNVEGDKCDISVVKNIQNTVDFDDPERRQRIEKYKEERRMFLREKFRSESFRGERDEILQRLKQKAGKNLPSPSDDTTDSSSQSGCEPMRSSSFRFSGNRTEHSGEGEFTRNSELPVNNDVPCEKDSDVKSKAKKNSVYELVGDEECGKRSRFFSLGQVGDEMHIKQNQKAQSPRESWTSHDNKQGVTGKTVSPTRSLDRRLSSRMHVDNTSVEKQYCLDSSKKQTGSVTEKISDKRTTGMVKSPRHTSSTEAYAEKRLTSKVCGVDSKSESNDDFLTDIRLTTKGFSIDRRKGSSDTRAVELRLTTKNIGDSQNCSPKRSSYDSAVVETRDCPRRRTASESPSYCIKDMAALFENKDVVDSSSTSRPAPGRLSSS